MGRVRELSDDLLRARAEITDLEAVVAAQQVAISAAQDWFVRNAVLDKKTSDGSTAVFGMLMTARSNQSASQLLERMQDAVREECARKVCSGCAEGLPVKRVRRAPNALNHVDSARPADLLYGPVQFACTARWNPAHRHALELCAAPVNR